MSEFRLETPRLTLRDWREEDIDPFHGICSDPVVMATLGPLMTREQTGALVARMHRMQAEIGHCIWAMERKDDAQLIGWCGLSPGAKGSSIEGKIDVGWRMTPAAWGKGFATEAAITSVQWAFDNLPDDAVWAITSTGNIRSRAVMERLEMEYLPDLDFDHPNVEADSPLLSHVTYRMTRGRWAKTQQQLY